MRLTLAATVLCLLPAALAQPAAAQVKRGPVYLSLMGEPFVGHHGHSPLAMWMAGADIDKDGAISLAELTADAERFFKSLDIDGDGRIGSEEMTRYEQEIAPAAVRAAGGMRPTPSPRAESSTTPGNQQGAAGDASGRPTVRTQETLELARRQNQTINRSSIPQPVAMADTDMSGFVTLEEFTRTAQRRFAAVDLDKNGLLDASELGGRR